VWESVPTGRCRRQLSRPWRRPSSDLLPARCSMRTAQLNRGSIGQHVQSVNAHSLEQCSSHVQTVPAVVSSGSAIASCEVPCQLRRQKSAQKGPYYHFFFPFALKSGVSLAYSPPFASSSVHGRIPGTPGTAAGKPCGGDGGQALSVSAPLATDGACRDISSKYAELITYGSVGIRAPAGTGAGGFLGTAGRASAGACIHDGGASALS